MNKDVMRKHYDKTSKETLINILINSREEIERLNNIIFNQNKRNSHQRIANDNLQNKNKELNNIINELEKYIISQMQEQETLKETKAPTYIFCKLQELKGSDKE